MWSLIVVIAILAVVIWADSRNNDNDDWNGFGGYPEGGMMI